MLMIHDLVCPDDPEGRTYKQINAAREHGIAVGTLVEIDSSGVRLFVVHAGRDSDMSPLYWLAATPSETNRSRWHGGYDEDALSPIGPTSHGRHE